MFEIEIFKKAKKDSKIREEVCKDNSNAVICIYQSADHKTHIFTGIEGAKVVDVVALLAAFDDLADELCKRNKPIAPLYGLYKLKKAAGMLKELKLADEQEESGDEQKD